ncbi:MAG: type II toxin-antitoxin system VapC family toxin [Acidobacteriaceae bacterium]
MAGRFLLDTHLVVDIATRSGFETIPVRVRRILEDPDAELLLSVASEAEVAIQSRIGKLQLTRSEFATICASASILSYPLRRHHADRLFDLPLHHSDPFDRLIISTALADDLPVISRDKQFRKYKDLRVIWQ